MERMSERKEFKWGMFVCLLACMRYIGYKNKKKIQLWYYAAVVATAAAVTLFADSSIQAVHIQSESFRAQMKCSKKKKSFGMKRSV